jgi:signal recognition particle receptor subunit beta
MMQRNHKLVFIGEPGAGKTTCIAALSQITPLSTDVACTDGLAELKATTTVALDYGEMNLADEGRLLLYGLPGQLRFRYMFDVVREGLLGVVILVDASRPSALAGLTETLSAYGSELKQLPCVVALNKHPDPPRELRGACRDLLRRHQLVAPILIVDARQRADVVRIFELLFLLLEHGPQRSTTEEVTTWA